MSSTIIDTYLQNTEPSSTFIDVWCGLTGLELFIDRLKGYSITSASVTITSEVFTDSLYYNIEVTGADSNDKKIYSELINLYKFYSKLRHEYIHENKFEPDTIYKDIIGETIGELVNINAFTTGTFVINSLLTNNVKLSKLLYTKLTTETEKAKYFSGNYLIYIEAMYYLYTSLLYNFSHNIVIAAKAQAETTGEAAETALSEFSDTLVIEMNQHMKESENILKLQDINKDITNIKKININIDKIREETNEINKDIDEYKRYNLYKIILLVLVVILIIIYYIFEEKIFTIFASIILLIIININIQNIINEDFETLDNLNIKILAYLDYISKNSLFNNIIGKDIDKELEKYQKKELEFKINLENLKFKLNNLMKSDYVKYTIISILLLSFIMIILIDKLNMKHLYYLKVLSSLAIIIVFVLIYALKNRTNFYKKDFVKPM